jgi:hypothetical protein
MAGALAGLFAVAAGLVAGCGGSAAARADTVDRAAAPLRAADVAALNAALAADQRAVAGYVASGPLLSGDAQRVDGWFLGQELSHAGALRSLIKGLGGAPHQPDPGYRLGHPRAHQALLGLLGSLERGQVAATAGAIPRVHEGWIRARLAAILADDAQHLAVLGTLAGRSPAASAVQIGRPASIDPADVGTIERLLRAQTIVATVLEWSLHPGRLAPWARSLVLYELSQERADTRELDRLLTSVGYPQPIRAAPAGLTLDQVLKTTAVSLPLSAVRGSRGWLRLIEDVELRFEGLLYYKTIALLSARDAQLAAMLLAREAQQSALIAELHRHRATQGAVPAAMVRGWRLRDQPSW